MKKCLDAEEQFAKMMMIKEEYEIKPLVNQDQFEYFHGFIRTSIHTISIVDVDQSESNVVKEKLPAVCERLEIDEDIFEPHESVDDLVVKEKLPAVCERLDDIIEPKEEHETDDDQKTVNKYEEYLDLNETPLHDSELNSEDDIPLMKVKTEVDEQKVSKMEQETDNKGSLLRRILSARSAKHDPTARVRSEDYVVGTPPTRTENTAEFGRSPVLVRNESGPSREPHSAPVGPSFRDVILDWNSEAQKRTYDDDNVGYQTATSLRKRPRIAERQQNMTNNESTQQKTIIIKNRRGTNLSGKLKAAEHIVQVYVSRFQNDITTEDIETYMKDNGQKVFSVEMLTSKNATNFKSFKISVEKKSVDTILCEDFWPEGIKIR